jgi:hypothetical protein
MSKKVVAIEEQEGPYQRLFQRIMRMVPDRDKDDKNLQRLLAFRLRVDGEAALSEYLIRKIRETIRCAYTGKLYDFLKDDFIEKACGNTADEEQKEPEPPEVA